jgi:glycosyltransferase involved in cell wall biosynthesis
MSSFEPTLSVIIACYNYAEFVGQAIESVLSQHNDACELLVVDDGSVDRSWDVIQSYGLAKCYRLPNGGAARACEFALRQSRAPFVLFLDADDELAPGSIETIVKRLDPGVAKLQFALTPIDACGRALGPPLPQLRNFRSRDSLRREVCRAGSYVSPPTSGNVFRRDLCEFLADVDYEMSVDGVTLFAAPFFGDVVSLAEPLGRYRLHGRNYSESGLRPNAGRFRKEAERFLDRHAHLARVLAQRNIRARLRDAHGLFFYRERLFYAAILEGKRPRLQDALDLAGLSLTADRPWTHRAAMASFVLMCWALPRGYRDALLRLRLSPARRERLLTIRPLVAVEP